MHENETISEAIIRLQKEYDFSNKSKKDGKDIIEGQMPAIVLELNDCWYARMTNGGNVTYIFWNGKNNDDSYVDIEVEAETAENALTKLEELCKTYKAKKYIIIDPISFDWW